MTLFEKALVIHLICDFILQNEWMALNKANWRSPAGYVHAGIHFFGLLLVFPFWVALFVAVTHWFIDLRFLLADWRRLYRQTTEGPAALHVAIWGDQVVHITILAAVIMWMVR